MTISVYYFPLHCLVLKVSSNLFKYKECLNNSSTSKLKEVFIEKWCSTLCIVLRLYF